MKKTEQTKVQAEVTEMNAKVAVVASDELSVLTQESIEVYQAIISGDFSSDELAELIERHFELEERRKELRENL